MLKPINMSGEPSKLEISMTLGRAAPAKAAMPKPLILLCDGTWCGREADTKSNIYKLAEMVGVNFDDDATLHRSSDRVFYIEGVGLGSSFLEYVSLLPFHVYSA